MIWGLDAVYWVLITYAVVGLFIGGVMYELEKDDLSDDAMQGILAVSVLWPLGAAFFGGWGVVWLLSWIPRGPTRLVVWLLNREPTADLPEARVVE